MILRDCGFKDIVLTEHGYSCKACGTVLPNFREEIRLTLSKKWLERLDDATGVGVNELLI